MSQPKIQRTDYRQRQQFQRLDRTSLGQHQLQRLRLMLGTILPENNFYAAKLADLDLQSVCSLEQLRDLPYTTKEELNDPSLNDAGYAANLTWDVDRYCRFHRTSGTRGRPMIVLDTKDDWQWWMEGWQCVLDAAQLTDADRVVMAFSFGPFIGFWSAFDAAIERGALVAPTGSMSTVARLELIRLFEATVLFCTPSYALHLLEVAKEQRVDITSSKLRAIIVAGEPGGSIPHIRTRIEQGFDAKVIDHSGASEVGPWGFPDDQGDGIHVNEAQFIAEFRSIETDQPAEEGGLAELVLTTLGRSGCPVIRYRTGDLVRPVWKHGFDSQFVFLDGGVLGRTDDMMIIRGVNVFPAAIEQILRGFQDVDEYRMTATRTAAMDELKIEVEDRLNDPQRIAGALQTQLGFRVQVETVEPGSLPRFEGKGKRFNDRRKS